MTLRQSDSRRLILILGGARSGKSSYAEALTTRIAKQEPVLFIATATPEDDEMRARIARHQAERPAHWLTVDAPVDPASVLREHAGAARVVLLDCVTLLVSNVLMGASHADFDEHTFDVMQAEARVTAAIADLLSAYSAGDATLILVSNEVGMGIVPAYPLGRVYRDALGRANAQIAQVADAAILLVAGLPVELKSLTARWEAHAATLFADQETQ